MTYNTSDAVRNVSVRGLKIVFLHFNITAKWQVEPNTVSSSMTSCMNCL